VVGGGLAACEYGEGLRPILFYAEGEITMADDAWDECGSEKPVEKAVVK
jgi:hypothetical protein